MNNNLITGVLAGVSGVLSYIFGPWDAMIMVLIAVVALDSSRAWLMLRYQRR